MEQGRPKQASNFCEQEEMHNQTWILLPPVRKQHHRSEEILEWILARAKDYLMGCLLSHVALQLLELVGGVSAELVIRLLQGIQLGRNVLLLLARKPAE